MFRPPEGADGHRRHEKAERRTDAFYRIFPSFFQNHRGCQTHQKNQHIQPPVVIRIGKQAENAVKQRYSRHEHSSGKKNGEPVLFLFQNITKGKRQADHWKISRPGRPVIFPDTGLGAHQLSREKKRTHCLKIIPVSAVNPS